ncbi:MAG TPA: hypothetical protein VGE39_17170 [Prosthecobacter sp.]
MNAPLSTDVAAIPQSTPITTVRDLRMRHSSMLQRQRSSESMARVSPGEMLGFLEAAQALGKLLEDRAQRENAQGVMDYWTAALLSVAPRAGEQTRPFTLAPFEKAAQTQAEKAAANEEDGLGKAIKSATTYYDNASTETQNTVLRLLRRLVRLKTNSLDPYANPQAITANDPSKAVLDALVKEGVLTTRPAPAADSSAAASATTTYDLAAPSLLFDWKPAYLIVKERRGFREMARGWDKSGRKKSALLQRGSELESLAAYTGLDDTEDAFFKASNEEAKQARQRAWVTGSLMCSLVIGLIGIVMVAWSLKNQTDTQKEATKKIEEKVVALNTANGEKDKALTRLTEARKLQEQTLTALKETNAAKDKALTELKKANADNGRLLEDLKKAVAEKEAALQRLDAAVEQFRKEVNDSNSVSTSIEQRYAGVLRDLQTLANLMAPRTDLPPEVTAIINQYRSKETAPPQEATTGQPLANALSHPNEKAEPQPGIRISVGDGDSSVSGSLGVFVKKKNSPETYLVAPRYLFTGAIGTKVYSGADMQKVIATLTDMSLSTHGLSDNVALAKVADGVNVSNSLPGLGLITELESHPVPDMKVRLVGSGSGISEGRIVSIGEDGFIKTTRLSQAGDAGAPVVTAEGNRLVGLLYGRSPDEQSLVVPASLLERYGLELATPTASVATSTPLQGALGEIFVADSDPGNILHAQKYVQALLDQGMIMPVPTAQPRRKVPADQSEVRCYDENLAQDKDSIAHRAMKLLIAAGIPAGKIEVKYVPDADAPRNFLQISLAKNALGRQAPAAKSSPQRGPSTSGKKPHEQKPDRMKVPD